VHAQDLEVRSIKKDKIRRIKLDGSHTEEINLSVPVRSIVVVVT